MSEAQRVNCPDCDNEMSEGGGCDVVQLMPVPNPVDRIPYLDPDPVDRIPYHDPREGGFLAPVCHDCGAGPGKYHHFGCDVERCPLCLGQLISCGHYFVPHTEELEGA